GNYARDNEIKIVFFDASPADCTALAAKFLEYSAATPAKSVKPDKIAERMRQNADVLMPVVETLFNVAYAMPGGLVADPFVLMLNRMAKRSREKALKAETGLQV